MKLYVYCLAEGVDAIAETIRGVSDAPVRLVKSEDFAVLVSDLESDTVPVNRENVLAHAAVVRSVLDQHNTTAISVWNTRYRSTTRQLHYKPKASNRGKARARARLRRDEREDHLGGCKRPD